MDILKEFELYLPQWAETNKKPIPDVNTINKLWTAAWESFMKERLMEDWQQRKESFLSMQLLTKTEMKKREKEKEISQILDEDMTTEEPSGWDKICKYMK